MPSDKALNRTSPKDFDGEYRKAKYEWKLNKEKEKQNEQ